MNGSCKALGGWLLLIVLFKDLLHGLFGFFLISSIKYSLKHLDNLHSYTCIQSDSITKLQMSPRVTWPFGQAGTLQRLLGSATTQQADQPIATLIHLMLRCGSHAELLCEE